MTINLMDNYLKKTKSFIKEFTKLFFLNDYDEEISNEYIETYIESRIYNYFEVEHRFFYRRIYAALLNKKKILQKEKYDEQILENNLKIYQFIFYLDGVRPINDLEEFCNSICEKRVKSFNLAPTRGLETRVIKLVKKYNLEKEEFFKKYETELFELKVEKYTLIEDTYKVSLKYNFKIPYIYSNQVINEVFTQGTINEDRLIIEYILLTMVCIQDINKGDFSTKYIVDFPNTLFNKQTKLNQTLRIINNAAIQDKVFLKISNKEFEENKEVIYSLMKDGFRFAFIINDEFDCSIANLKKLSMFNYLLVLEESKNYEKIKNISSELNNIIIYDR